MYASITKAPLPLPASEETVDILLVVDEQMKLDMNNGEFGDYLQALMDKRNVSISDLSGLTGYAELTICRMLHNIEQYKDSDCLPDYVCCICIALRLDYHELRGLANRAGFRIRDDDERDLKIEFWIGACSRDENVNVISVNYRLMQKEMKPLLPNYAIRRSQDDICSNER